ncbi:MAG TPA: SDR family NAD(P)-dependent oxidoreductase [Methylosinus sp.]
MKARRILITGASSGIGRALALAYAREGRSLALYGRDGNRLEETASACRAAGAEADATIVDVRDRHAMAARIAESDARAPLDLVVANAGVSTGLAAGQIAEDPEAVRGALAINVLGVFNTVEPAIEAMTARGRGQIALVGSMAGLRGLPYSPAYCASKAAVHLYADSLRGALAPHGVQVSLIVPGFVTTPMTAGLEAWQPGRISDAKAAEIILRGLERNAAVIAFPLFVYYAMKLFAWLPPRAVDSVMRRFEVTVPQTKEREEP